MNTDKKKSYVIDWLGYNEKVTHGQIWGYLTMTDGRVFAFWGTSKGKILFKRHHYQVSFLAEQKIRKGFRKIDPDHYEIIRPNFREDLEIWLTSAILSDDF